MQTTEIIAEEVFRHHIGSLGNNDLEELMKDYMEQSELWTPNGSIVGLEAISSFFSYAFTLFPKGKTSLDIKKLIADEDKVYIVWTADSPVVNVPFGSDSFYIRDGKILWQSTAFQITQK
jgi:hypothetical protein